MTASFARPGPLARVGAIGIPPTGDPPRAPHLACSHHVRGLASGFGGKRLPIAPMRVQRPAERPRYTPAASLIPALAAPLLTDTWSVFAVLASASWLGKRCESTKWGQALSGPLVATLLGLACSNLGFIPTEHVVYPFVNKYLLPLAVPMLLLSADLRKVLRDTGRLLGAFAIGAVGTVVGTLGAFKLIPMRSLGVDSWKVASSLAARHIGGAINYVAVSEALEVTPSVVASGLAADNLICAVYFTSVFLLASGIPPDPPQGGAGEAGAGAGEEVKAGEESEFGGSLTKVSVWECMAVISMSSILCAVGTGIATALGSPGYSIPVISTLAVIAATVLPAVFGPFAPAGETLASVILPLFFATVGANGDIARVVATAPSLFLFSAAQIACHLGFVMAVGKLFGYTRKEVLLASNANVGGPQTAGGMASAKGWRRSVVPAILIGTFGYATATIISCALGVGVLSKWP